MTNLELDLQQLARKVNTAGTDENRSRLVAVLGHGARGVLLLELGPNLCSAWMEMDYNFKKLGHPLSSIVAFRVFEKPLINRLIMICSPLENSLEIFVLS